MQCFVISPIGKEGSEQRRNADLVLEFIIRDALNPLGFSIERADLVSESGLITTQIIDRILSCDLLIADLTGHNPNVFYELAIRHIVRKPFIHLIRDAEALPFDVAASRAIFYALDLPGAKKASIELQRQAQAVLDGKGGSESPVSVSLDLKVLESRGDPTAAGFSKIESEIFELRRSIESLAAIVGALGMRSVIWSDLIDSSLSENRNALANLINESSFRRSPRQTIGWTEERVQLLRKRWDEGASATQIANELGGGLSRNAVIGKLHRIGAYKANPSEPQE